MNTQLNLHKVNSTNVLVLNRETRFEFDNSVPNFVEIIKKYLILYKAFHDDFFATNVIESSLPELIITSNSKQIVPDQFTIMLKIPDLWQCDYMLLHANINNKHENLLVSTLKERKNNQNALDNSVKLLKTLSDKNNSKIDRTCEICGKKVMTFLARNFGVKENRNTYHLIHFKCAFKDYYNPKPNTMISKIHTIINFMKAFDIGNKLKEQLQTNNYKNQTQVMVLRFQKIFKTTFNQIVQHKDYLSHLSTITNISEHTLIDLNKQIQTPNSALSNLLSVAFEKRYLMALPSKYRYSGLDKDDKFTLEIKQLQRYIDTSKLDDKVAFRIITNILSTKEEIEMINFD